MTTSGNVSGDAFATEFVGGSITSSFLDQPFASVAEQSRDTNPHMRYQRFDRRGYGVLELTADSLSAQYRSPATIEETTSQVETIASFRVAHGDTEVEQTG